MTSAWSQLEQLLTCCVCLDRFRNPKLLPCQHTFCGEPCLEGLVDYARRQIKCPECRAEHRIPYNGVQTFPNNVTLARFLDLHRGITGEEPEPLPSQMDRCGVCGEKAFCEKCSHCDKKVCEECKEAHLDILRREITRINNQIRRGLNKLTEHSSQSARNCDKLQSNCKQIRDEITESVRRIIKDLKDKESKLLHDLEEYTQTEAKGGEKTKEDLDQELLNITSNCELIENHINENEEWTDSELVEYKEILVKTLEFLRNLDPDTSDFARKVKFHYKTDFDVLRRSVADFAEIKITTPNVMLSPSESSSNLNSLLVPNQTNLLRSQSDHRLAQQFQRGKTESSRYLDISGSQSRLSALTHSDTERDNRLERNTSPTRQRYSRFGREVEDRESRNRFDTSSALTRGWPRPSDSDEPSIGTTTHFRSRFMRERNNQELSSFEDSHDSDYGGSHRSVRFEEPNTNQPRVKVFETEEVTKGPMSGVIKLIDSPFVMQRLHQNEVRQKLKEQEALNAPPPAPQPPPPVSTPTPTPRRAPSRQVSEDEIEKQKKANHVAAAAAAANPIPAPTPVPQSPKTSVPQSPTTVPDSPTTRIINRRLTQLQKEDSVTRYSPDSSRHGSDAEESALGDDSDTNSGVGRFSRRRDESESPRVSRQTSTQRSVRSPLGKNPSIDRSDRSDRHHSTNTSPHSAVAQTISDTTVDTNSRQSTQTISTSDKTNIRTLSTDIDTESSDSNASNDSSADSESESEEEDNSNLKPSITSPAVAANATVSASSGRHPTSSSLDKQQERSERNIQMPASVSTLLNRSAQARKDNLNAINRSDSPSATPSTRFSRQNTLTDEPNSGSDRPLYKGRRASDATKEDYTPTYQSRRNLSRAATLEDEEDQPVTSSAYSRFLSRSKTSSALAAAKEDTTAAATGDDSRFTYTRRPDKFGFDDSDEETVSPTYKSKYGESALPTRRTSRSSGYTYRTRDPGSPPPEDETGQSVAQYLINKYGTKTSIASKSEPSNRTNSILKSKSSHVIYGRSISSSDDEPPISIRRSSRDDSSASLMSSIKTSSFGLTYPRQMYLQKGKLMMKLGSRGTEAGCFTWPRGVAVGQNNSIVVADSSNHRVQVFDSTGRFSFEFGSYGSGEGEFDCLAGVCVNKIGQFIVSDRYNHRIQVFDASGRFMRAFGSEGRSDSRFSYPWGIAVDALGFIYVCDKENHRIQVFQSDGLFVGKFGTIGSRTGMLEHPHYIAVSNTNRVVISDSNNHRIQIFDVNGRSLSTFGSEGSNEGQFKFPRGVAVDDQGFIIVGDSGNNRVQIFNPDGTFLKAFGTWGSSEGEFKGLEGVAITSTGNILVCDRENHRIQMF